MRRGLEVRFAGSAADATGFPRDGLPEVALLGRSNVGKSALLNALCGRRALARVSSTPGRTRLVNFFRVGDELYLVDLPGYGFAKVARQVRSGFEALALAYLQGRRRLALALMLVDGRLEPQAADQALARWLDHQAVPWAIAATKADKLSRGRGLQAQAALRAHYGREVIWTSAQAGTGLEELWGLIRSAILACRATPEPASNPRG